MNKTEGISHIAYFRSDGGNQRLYTQEYVDGLKEELKTTNEALNILSNCNREYCKLNNEIKEYCDSILERDIDVSDTDFDLGQYGVARDIKSKLDKYSKISFEELLKGTK